MNSLKENFRCNLLYFKTTSAFFCLQNTIYEAKLGMD